MKFQGSAYLSIPGNGKPRFQAPCLHYESNYNVRKAYKKLLDQYGLDHISTVHGRKSNNARKESIAIIGGGWYGCHLARALSIRGYPVQIFEANDDLFQGASALNTFRLHRGFHYPRSVTTRLQCKEGFEKFVEDYPALSKMQSSAIYAISKDLPTSNKGKSVKEGIRFNKYKEIMDESGLNYKDIEATDLIKYQNIEGMVDTNERTIYVDLPREYFRSVLTGLGVDISYNSRVICLQNKDDGKVDVSYYTFDKKSIASVKNRTESFDYVINCTYNTYKPIKDLSATYESCIQLIYSSKVKNERPFSFSIFDGEFPSIDPFEFYFRPHGSSSKQFYIMSHVKLTPIKKYSTYSEARQHQSSLSKEEIVGLKDDFEKAFQDYFPDFYRYFSYEGYALSIKSKPNIQKKSEADFRGVITRQEGNIIHVFSGKIDTIFQAKCDVFNILKRNQ
ncbi:uncharacterized protein TRIADDRAFT_58655 [Trichoplax adhaerens]|uniref:L-2-hydroxyglutarate dehydrogenase, mitochondrial n=1 Tax=Trichoplax adhaerens TaxID=10228 RepID=B3S3B0_TRIAD|nr:hypothetical protein TRIADDRAFT_58655 [Trichoplax adhaerens]EDV22759.1 hypothetical protein TRIADDRAFT_58655 [Trichoplax adhaerens]|eukprot:XP_002114625.1 hypothetical protein TRIADDRAFT_58655 [Trichoplax adhaerens]